MGLEVEMIHACKELLKRWHGIFPIIPRFKRLFASSKEAQLMRWHKEGHKDNGYFLRHPADSTQWRTFDGKHGKFAEDARNDRFALSMDGINTFGNMSIAPIVYGLFYYLSIIFHLGILTRGNTS